jgi:hypothetical protein
VGIKCNGILGVNEFHVGATLTRLCLIPMVAANSFMLKRVKEQQEKEKKEKEKKEKEKEKPKQPTPIEKAPKIKLSWIKP